MSIRHGLVFAMEDDQVITDEVVENTGEIEAGAAEVVQQAGEVEELQAAIEDAEEGAETLGQIEGVLEESAESGEGVDETAAEIAEVAVESIRARLGIRGGNTFPAMESFGSSNSRLSATKIALEGVKETIIRIWEAIKQAVIRLWEKVKSFVIGLFKNNAQMSKHLEKLLDRAKNMPETAKPEKTELDNKSLAKTFSVAKKANLGTARTLIGNAEKLLGATNKISSISETFSTNITSAASRLENGQELAHAKVAFETSLTSALVSLGNMGKATGEAGNDKKESITYYGPFVGTRVVAFKRKEVKTGTDTEIRVSMDLTTYEKIEAEKISALKRDEVYEIVKEAIKLSDTLSAHEKAQGAKAKISEKLRKTTEEVISEVKKATDESKDQEKARVLRQVQADVSDVNAILASLSVSFPGVVFSTVKAVADYASASLANLKTASK